MKTTTGSNTHKGSYFLIPTVNMIINKARDKRFKDNYQFHFNFLSFSLLDIIRGTIKLCEVRGDSIKTGSLFKKYNLEL